MTVSISVYDKGERIFHQMALGKNMSMVDDYLRGNDVQYETGKEHDDVADYSKEKQEKVILLDNTNVLGVDGNAANFVSEYWVEYDEAVLHGLIQSLENQ